MKSGMEAHELKRLKELKAENTRLKKMYADLARPHICLLTVYNRQATVYHFELLKMHI
jgi:hypothetical protein